MAGLGDMLVADGVATREQIDEAQQHGDDRDASLTQSLVQLGFTSEERIVQALAARLDMPYTAAGPGDVEARAAELLPRQIAEQHTALPVSLGDGDELIVAVAEPNNQAAKRAVEEATGLPVTLALAPRKRLQEAIRELTAPADDVAGITTTGTGAPGSNGPVATASETTRTSAEASPRAGGSGRGSGLDGVDIGPGLDYEEESDVDLDKLLVELVEKGGSDLHLTAGVPPSIRVDGDLKAMEHHPVLEPKELQKMLYAIMTQKQREEFENTLELDMSYSIGDVGRFRVNIFQQRDSLGSVMRAIPYEILSLEKLGLPDQLENLCYLPRGFVLVTGPTGSGKSTTLASMIDIVNRNRPVHIMTIEDPIEFLHEHKRALVNQREVGSDTLSFPGALKHVLRQDPDVILVGELRDLETIQVALTAAETGHLVFGTLHTQDAPQTIDRIIDVFPPHQQEQIRVQLAGALRGVCSQTLLKRADGDGRVVATELMITTPAIKNLIREGKTHQIYSAIQSGAQHGMQALDQDLARLVKQGVVSYDLAAEKASDLNEFNRLTDRT